MKKFVGIRLEESDGERIKAAAKYENRSMNNFIETTVMREVERIEKEAEKENGKA
jgi:predicted HicB family RNase H-like nuclease